jgi:HEAT repeat protein
MPSIPSDPVDSKRDQNEPRRPAPVSADALLPPVEPPSAGFLLQLFVVPAVIVAAVVLLWFVIESLARSGEQDPDAIVAALRSSNQARFQQAKDLADMLRVPERYPELKANHELARKLGELLQEQVAAGADDEGSVTMRYFLATALGEFHVDDGLPALLEAAERDPDRDVRRRAVNAIAVLAGSLAALTPPQSLARDEVIEPLLALADDQDELIRSETAFALGIVGMTAEDDSRLEDALRRLADDPYTDARFNAAAGLARLGSPLAPSTVAEMFEFEAIGSSISGEKPLTEDQTKQELRSQQAYKRDTILSSALSAVDLMLEHGLKGPALAPVEKALAAFIAQAPKVQDPAPVPPELIDAARATLERVKAAGS